MKIKKVKKIKGEKLAKRVFVSTGIITILILSLYLLQIHLTSKASSVLGTESETETALTDLSYWKEYLTQYPSYFPGWIELARLESDQQNFEGFIYALKKAENLNPNSTEVKELKFRYGL